MLAVSDAGSDRCHPCAQTVHAAVAIPL